MTTRTPITAGAASPGADAGPGGADAILVCRDLRRRFGDRTAVDGVGSHIAPGETCGLLGPNDAGKTTTSLTR